MTKTHFAVFPPELVETPIKAGCPENGVVLDPFFGCFDDKTEVLTKRGWCLFSSLKQDDLICSLNPKTHQIEFVNFIRFIKYHYKGKMYQILGRSIDLLVTPNHKIYAKEYHHRVFSLHEIDKFNYSTFHKLNQGKWISNKSFNPNMLKLIGFWIGDGYKITRNKNSRGYRIGFHLKKERKIKYLEELLKKLNIPFNKYKEKTGYFVFHIHNKKLYNFLEGKSHTKRVPKFIFELSSKHILYFLEGIFQSDGYKSAIYSVNKELINDLQILALLSGRSAVIQERKRKFVFVKGTKINSNNKQYELYFHKHNKKIQLTNANIYKRNYNSNVFDVTLKKNHILYVRRNGKPCWSGNSGTTGMTALKLGRKFVGIDVSEEYVKLAEARLKPFKEQKKLFEY